MTLIGKQIAVMLVAAIFATLTGILLSDDPTPAQAQTNTLATGAPLIEGAVQLDEELTVCTWRCIDDADGMTNVSFSYQWIRRDGTTDTDIDIVAADVGKTLKVRVSFDDDERNPETLTSAPTATVSGQRNSDPAGLPTISGMPQVGQKLTVNTSGISDADGLINVKYGGNWSAGEGYLRALIAPGKDLSYTVSRRDAGMTLDITVNFEDDAGKTHFLTSAKTVVVAATSPAAPENFEASATDPGELDLSWEAPTWDLSGEISGDPTWGDGGSDITGYVVQSKEESDSWDTAADVSEATVTGTSHTIEGLTGGTEYTTRVIAVNDVGRGAPSDEATATVVSASTDATLSALTLSGIDFGTFDPETLEYTAQVYHGATRTNVTATRNHPKATYVVKLGGVLETDGVILLSGGSNVITVEVTAEDGQTMRTYSVTVTRPVSNNAHLINLTFSRISLEHGSIFYPPGFSSLVFNYTPSVAHSLTETTVTPTAHDFATYVIKLDGVTDADGVIALSVGSNVITIEVTAEDEESTKTYTIIVTRAAAPLTDATLKSLLLSGIDIGSGMGVGAIVPTDTSYTASVYHSVSQTTVTPTVNHSGASYVIKLGGVEDADGTVSLAVGSNVITVEVTADDDSTTKTYTVTVNRATASASTTGELSTDDPPVNFRTITIAHDHGIYSFSFPRNRGIFGWVIQRYEHDGSSFVSSGSDMRSDHTGTKDLGGEGFKLGDSNVEPGVLYKWVLMLTDSQGSTVIETSLTVRAPALSSDASLSALTLSGVNFGTFRSSTTSYTARVANSVSQTTVTPTVNHSGASYVIKLADVEDADGVIPLSMGSNVITIEVTAEDDSTTETYTVTVTRGAASTDATLKTLTLSSVDLGTFASGTTSYTAQVTNSVFQTTVSPTVNDSGASYVVKLGSVTNADGVISLRVGSNVITVEVTAEDGNTTKTYTVTVTRAAPPSTDATLSALALSGVDFGTFDSTTTSYTAQVKNNVSQTTVAPTANDSGANYVIKLGGATDADGVIPLAVGINIVNVEVTAEDDSTTKTYTVTVTRASPPSTDAALSALTLSGVNFGSFTLGTISYTAQVANTVTQTTVIPTVNDSGAAYVIKLGGVKDADGVIEFSVGSNVITVEVTAEDDSTTRTYTVTVTRAEPVTPQLSSDAALSALTLSSVDFGTFDSTTTSYTAQAANSVSQTTVAPTVNHSGASYVIKRGGVTDSDGVIALSVGSNVITIEVTAEDGSTTRTYTVTVTRAAPPSTDATLSALTLSGVDFGTFASGTTSYTAQVANSVSQTTVSPTVNDSGAGYLTKLGGVTDADGVVLLAVGSNVITVEVTAEDDSTTRTYTVTVTRAAATEPETLRERVMAMYDSDGNGDIDKDEAITAVIDYFDGLISKEEAIEVVLIYFSTPG